MVADFLIAQMIDGTVYTDELALKCVSQVRPLGGGRLTAQRYCDDILRLSSATASWNHFQHENGRSHTARLSRNFLANANVHQVLSWPVYSPDINPIQLLGDHLDRQIRRGRVPEVTVGLGMMSTQE